MADRLKRGAAARMGRNARGNLPSRFDLGTWLGGEEAAEAARIEQRLDEAFATSPYMLPDAVPSAPNSRSTASNDPQTSYDIVGGLLGDALPEFGLALFMDGPLDPVRIGPLPESYEPLDQVGEMEGNSKTGRLQKPIVLQGDEPVQLQPDSLSLRQHYSNLIGEGLIQLGVKPWTAHKQANGLMSLAEFSPLGLITAADEAKRAFKRGDYIESGIAALGAIPMFRGARGPLKATADDVAKAVEKWQPTIFHEVEKLLDVPQHNLPRYEPPKGTPSRIYDLINDPTVSKGLLGIAQQGDVLGGTRWHYADPLRLMYWRGHEKKEAGEVDFRLFANLLAATSTLSDVATNIRLASYYNYLIKKTKGNPDLSVRNPYPYGHRLEARHKANVKRVLEGGLDSIRNPKPSSMGYNFIGNELPVQVDSKIYRMPAILLGDPRGLKTRYRVGTDGPIVNPRQMVERAELAIEDAQQYPNLWRSAPLKTEYGALERYIQNLSRVYGVPPSAFEGALWVGGAQIAGLRTDPSKPFLGLLEDRATATVDYYKKLGEWYDPEDVVRRSLVRGEFPLRTLAGIGLGAAAARGSLGEYLADRDDESTQRNRDASLRDPRT